MLLIQKICVQWLSFWGLGIDVAHAAWRRCLWGLALGREADGEAFLLKTPRGPCGPWSWPHHACSGGRALFVSCPVCLGRQRPPLESGAPPQGPGPLPAARGAGLDRISCTAFRGPGGGGGSSRSQCDALQPGGVPGVSKLGPGFLLFSAHTAAAFVTAP
mgnify:CR=1 FL=1